MSTRWTTRTRACRGASGFTLIELMVTLVVAGILLMIAVPSFKRLMVSTHLNTAANAVVDAVNLARLDAIKLNTATQFCGNTSGSNGNDTLGSACGSNAGAVYAMTQGASATQVQATPADLAAPVQIASAGFAGIRFSGQGFGYQATGTPSTPYQGSVAVICSAEISSDNQRVIDMASGSVLTVTSSTGACP